MISLFTCHQIKNTIFHLIQTLLGIAFPISSFVWTDCLSIYVYGVSTGQDWVMHENWLFRRFFFAAWFIPLICIFLLCIYEYANQGRYDNLGTNTSTGGWCWVTTLTEKLIGGKVVEIASYGIIVFFYYRSWRILKDIERRQLRNTNDKSNGVLQRLLLVPVLFICFRIWSTIRIFTEKFDAGPRVDSVFYKLLGTLDKDSSILWFLYFFTTRFEINITIISVALKKTFQWTLIEFVRSRQVLIRILEALVSFTALIIQVRSFPTKS